MLRQEVEARGFVVNTPREDTQRGGTLCFDRDGAQALSQALLARRMLHDYRPRCGLRVSPHYYTTDDEILRFVAAIDELG
jgi:kynureninase